MFSSTWTFFPLLRPSFRCSVCAQLLSPASESHSPFPRIMETSPKKHEEPGLLKTPAVYFPVNTLMLRKAGLTPGEEFLLDGQQVELVKITCRVPEIHEGSQRFEFKFADEFGSFQGLLYRPSTGTPRPLRHFNTSTYHFSDYVTVVGHLRKFQGLAWLLVDWLEEVQSYDEVLQHRAQVLWAWTQRRGKLQEWSSEREASKLGEEGCA